MHGGVHCARLACMAGCTFGSTAKSTSFKVGKMDIGKVRTQAVVCMNGCAGASLACMTCCLAEACATASIMRPQPAFSASEASTETCVGLITFPCLYALADCDWCSDQRGQGSDKCGQGGCMLLPQVLVMQL